MKNMKRLFVGVAAVLSLVSAVGCGPKKPDGMPPLYPCVLTFVQGDRPVADVLVNLYPEDGSDSRWRAGGTTDANGKIELRTLAQYKGVPEGTYKVTAYKTLISDGPEPTEEQIKNGDTNFVATSTRYVDSKFEFPDQTPLRLTVKAGKNAETFDLGEAIQEEEEVPAAGY